MPKAIIRRERALRAVATGRRVRERAGSASRGHGKRIRTVWLRRYPLPSGLGGGEGLGIEHWDGAGLCLGCDVDCREAGIPIRRVGAGHNQNVPGRRHPGSNRTKLPRETTTDIQLYFCYRLHLSEPMTRQSTATSAASKSQYVTDTRLMETTLPTYSCPSACRGDIACLQPQEVIMYL